MASRNRRLPGAGLIAALLLFVGLSAAFMGGAIFSSELDTANRVIAVSIFIPLVAATLAFAAALSEALFGRIVARRRWKRFNAELVAEGFREATDEEIEDTLAIPVLILDPTILSEGRGGGIDHVTVGRLRGQEVRAFNIRVRGGGWMDVPAVALRAGAMFAETTIRPLRFAPPPRPGMRRVRFESERFNRSISVHTEDPYFGSALIDARMMEWILADLRGTSVELGDRWVLLWSWKRWGRRIGPRQLLETLSQLDERMPRVIPSLFPHADVYEAASTPPS